MILLFGDSPHCHSGQELGKLTMGNEELVLQANDILALADRLIMRNPGCITPGTS